MCFLTTYKKSSRIFLLVAGFVMMALVSKAQTPPDRTVLQLSGLVVSGDSAYGVSGVYIYTNSQGRGTVTNYYGYFSMPVLTQDTLLIKAVGYKKQRFIVPDTMTDHLSIMIFLKEDTLTTPMVRITPWKTERLFKEAFVALDLPKQELTNMEKNLNNQVMARMLYTMKADGSMNHTYFMQQYVQRQEMSRNFFYPTYTQQFMNPFAWAQFIRQVKNGGLKNDQPDYNTYDDE